MRNDLDRAVLTVVRRDGTWMLELEGEVIGRSDEKEICKAAANRLAREIQDDGRACRIQVWGEHGFFGAP